MSGDIIIRRATAGDNLVLISELIYGVDPYIYPYWFGSIDKCREELPKLLLDKNFIFNIDTFYVAIDGRNNKIIGVVSLIDKFTSLEYDYDNLSRYNERYNYTINNYIKPMIDSVKNDNIATVTNICVAKEYRNRHIGYNLLNTLIQDYIASSSNRDISAVIEFEVLEDNDSAIKLYNNLGFKQVGDVVKGFNGPSMCLPDVIIMRKNL